MTPPVGSNQKTEHEELAPTVQKPLVGSNQKTDIEEVATLLQTPPVGSNQKTERRDVTPTTTSIATLDLIE